MSENQPATPHPRTGLKSRGAPNPFAALAEAVAEAETAPAIPPRSPRSRPTLVRIPRVEAVPTEPSTANGRKALIRTETDELLVRALEPPPAFSFDTDETEEELRQSAGNQFFCADTENVEFHATVAPPSLSNGKKTPTRKTLNRSQNSVAVAWNPVLDSLDGDGAYGYHVPPPILARKQQTATQNVPFNVIERKHTVASTQEQSVVSTKEQDEDYIDVATAVPIMSQGHIAKAGTDDEDYVDVASATPPDVKRANSEDDYIEVENTKNSCEAHIGKSDAIVLPTADAVIENAMKYKLLVDDPSSTRHSFYEELNSQKDTFEYIGDVTAQVLQNAQKLEKERESSKDTLRSQSMQNTHKLEKERKNPRDTLRSQSEGSSKIPFGYVSPESVLNMAKERRNSTSAVRIPVERPDTNLSDDNAAPPIPSRNRESYNSAELPPPPIPARSSHTSTTKMEGPAFQSQLAYLGTTTEANMTHSGRLLDVGGESSKGDVICTIDVHHPCKLRFLDPMTHKVCGGISLALGASVKKNGVILELSLPDVGQVRRLAAPSEKEAEIWLVTISKHLQNRDATMGGAGNMGDYSILETSDWWEQGKMSRIEAENQLREWGLVDGIFLVRESAQPAAPGFKNFVLSMWSQGDMTHSLVKVDCATGEALYSTRQTCGVIEKVYESVGSMINHYQDNPYANGTRLVKINPVQKRVSYDV